MHLGLLLPTIRVEQLVQDLPSHHKQVEKGEKYRKNQNPGFRFWAMGSAGL